MENQINILLWVGNFLAGKYDSLDTKTQCEAGWYDWFCKDSSLAARTKKLGKKLIQILKSRKFDPSRTYVFFQKQLSLQWIII